ncbi:hypothetical protein ACFVGY_18640 [Streptomyces sp. NPDC127106]|uniref:hypothetical protein n=1 Tax=Streptomyces sp. NPDC127106 TaxID=3345360 RepID=UPI00363B2091
MSWVSYWQTVYERHRRWSADGTWQRFLGELQIKADAADADADGVLAGALKDGLRQTGCVGRASVIASEG